MPQRVPAAPDSRSLSETPISRRRADGRVQRSHSRTAAGRPTCAEGGAARSPALFQGAPVQPIVGAASSAFGRSKRREHEPSHDRRASSTGWDREPLEVDRGRWRLTAERLARDEPTRLERSRDGGRDSEISLLAERGGDRLGSALACRCRGAAQQPLTARGWMFASATARCGTSRVRCFACETRGAPRRRR